jgi:hypothetical protein
MFVRPKFSVFRFWAAPSLSKQTNGDSSRLLSSPGYPAAQERKANINLPAFFTVVALLFVLAEHFGRVEEQPDANLNPNSTALVNLTLSPPERSGNGSGFSVRFQLSNRGNHPIFYPINTTTRAPVGQLVERPSPSSDWMSIASTSKQRVPAVQEFTDSSFPWIEMPPGGWVDGKFHDPGESPEEHAFAIYVKPARDANGIRIISKSYAPPVN